jgi:hypothetical protein
MAAGRLSYIRQQVEEHIAAHWTATSISWPNAAFTPPADGAWIQVSILPGQAEQITLGTAGENRLYGVVHVNLFVPLNQGMGEAWTMADSLRALFNRITIGAIRFCVPSAGAPLLSESWWQIPLNCPFAVDETMA